jgi:hypothetical protein
MRDRTRDEIVTTLLECEQLNEELLEALAEARKDRAYAGVAGFMFGVLATLAAHSWGWF